MVMGQQPSAITLTKGAIPPWLFGLGTGWRSPAFAGYGPLMERDGVRRRLLVGGMVGLSLAPRTACGAGLSVRQVIARLHGPSPANFEGADLSRLDLADLDLGGARLAGANLFGADLTGARFAGADLRGANLDRTTMIRADFSNATMTGVTMMLPAASTLLDQNPAHEAPIFRGADLSFARVLAKLGNADWTGARLTDAHFELGRTQFLAALRSDLAGCVMAGTDLAGTNLAGVKLAFADLRGANLRGANLEGADLAGVRLDGADLRGARMARCDLNRAALRGVIGLDAAMGLADAFNLDLADH